jgi:hypothetical protein
MVYVPKKKEIYVDIENFKKGGLYALDDTTKAPIGSFMIMRNAQITDRGGIAPRFGTEVLGSNNSSSLAVKGLYNYKRSFGEDELLIKTYDDEIEYISKNNLTAGWNRLKSGFTVGKEFGFVTSLVNTDSQDYVIFCNRYEPYQRWSGAVTLLNGALVGGETSVTVDSVLTQEVYYAGTATSNSATTIDLTGAGWASSQWVNMYVHIVGTGKIRKITANTASQITFDTLGAGPGNVAFQIRQLAFPVSGTIIYNGTNIAYSGMDIATAFTVSSAHAASDNSAVTLVPTEYTGAPRGNRLANYLNRIVVGNVRSAMARDSGGSLQGYSSAGSYFVSKINNPFDFSFTATRIAGEGDIVSTPYGGGEITDVSTQENTAYVFKEQYIESVKYSQDANDLAVREPLKSGIGAVHKTIKGQDDVYFMTKDGEFTSIGRVETKDILPQTKNLGFNIKRYLEAFDNDEFAGIEDRGKIYFFVKSTSNADYNDLVVIYNKQYKIFEGVWDLSLNWATQFGDDVVAGQSNSANVIKLFKGTADVVGTDRYPIFSQCQSNFMNLTSSKITLQALNAVYFEGYITPGTDVTFKVFKDFQTTPFLQFVFSGSETSLLDGTITGSFLGDGPIGLNPVGSYIQGTDGRYHFQFRVYIPFQYGNYFSVGWESQGTDLDYEVLRYGLGLKEDVSVDTNSIKNI